MHFLMLYQSHQACSKATYVNANVIDSNTPYINANLQLAVKSAEKPCYVNTDAANKVRFIRF